MALPGHTQDSKGPHSCRGTDPSFWNPRQCSPLVRVAWSSGPMHKKSIKHLTGAGLDRPLTILSFLLWILWLNRPPLTPHCPPLPPSFQDRLDLSRELGTSPATLSTKIFSHICPRPVETAAGGLLVLLLASESGSESNPWQTMGFVPVVGRGPPRWRGLQCISSCLQQCGAIIPSTVMNVIVCLRGEPICQCYLPAGAAEGQGYPAALPWCSGCL